MVGLSIWYGFGALHDRALVVHARVRTGFRARDRDLTRGPHLPVLHDQGLPKTVPVGRVGRIVFGLPWSASPARSAWRRRPTSSGPRWACWPASWSSARPDRSSTACCPNRVRPRTTSAGSRLASRPVGPPGPGSPAVPSGRARRGRSARRRYRHRPRRYAGPRRGRPGRSRRPGPGAPRRRPGDVPAISVGQDVADWDQSIVGPGAQEIMLTLAENLELENRRSCATTGPSSPPSITATGSRRCRPGCRPRSRAGPRRSPATGSRPRRCPSSSVRGAGRAQPRLRCPRDGRAGDLRRGRGAQAQADVGVRPKDVRRAAGHRRALAERGRCFHLGGREPTQARHEVVL